MRNGKIAKLPSTIRDDLNCRMEKGEDGPELLAWLNGLPEVQDASRPATRARPSTSKTSANGASAASANGISSTT